MSVSQNYYILKYKIRQAVEANASGKQTLTKSEVETLKLTQKQVSWLNKAFYCYAIVDFAWTVRTLMRSYAANSHLVQVKAFRNVAFLTIRIALLSEGLSQFEMHHMRSVCAPILAKQQHDGEKEKLLKKMAEL
jgi:hypothetical protein